ELLNVSEKSDVGPCWVEPHEHKEQGYEGGVDTLLQTSRESLLVGWRSDAEILARKALDFDVKATLAHPLVSHRDLLKHALSEDDPLARWLPPSRIGVREDNQFGIWGE